MKKCLAGIALSLFVLTSTYAEAKSDYSLLRAFKLSELIVSGTVKNQIYVYRDGMLGGRVRMITTDVVIEVDEVLKGKPNIDKDTVKFMVYGGQGLDEHGNVYWANVSSEPKFVIGEKVLIMLGTSDDPYFNGYPYDKLHLYLDKYGKRVINENKVQFRFLLDSGKTKIVTFPVDLVVKFAQVFKLDKPSAVRLNDIVEAAAQASSSGVVDLSNEVINSMNAIIESVLSKEK